MKYSLFICFLSLLVMGGNPSLGIAFWMAFIVFVVSVLTFSKKAQRLWKK